MFTEAQMESEMEKAFRCARCPRQIRSGDLRVKIGRFTYCEECEQAATDELLRQYEAYAKKHIATKTDPLRTFSGWIEKFKK
jgi:hypothetical protein